MPLADVLSALREIIITEASKIPQAREQREEFFKSRFPNLEPIEIEDLVKIPPERFAIYTRTVFTGEANVLAKHLPLFFLLLKENWHRTSNKSFTKRTLIQNTQKEFPWKSQNTYGLIKSVLSFLKKEHGILFDELPYLEDVLKLEKLTLRTKRAANNKKISKKEIKEEELKKLTVSSLLELDFRVSKNCQFLKTSYDIIAYRKDFYENEKTLPLESPSKEVLYLISHRDSKHKIYWSKLRDFSFNFLESLEKEKLYSLKKLARVFSENIKEEEEKAFREFYNALSFLLRNEVIKLYSSKQA